MPFKGTLMFVFQELIRSIASLVNIVFTVLYWMLVARIILSWFGVSPYTTAQVTLGPSG